MRSKYDVLPRSPMGTTKLFSLRLREKESSERERWTHNELHDEGLDRVGDGEDDHGRGNNAPRSDGLRLRVDQ